MIGLLLLREGIIEDDHERVLFREFIPDHVVFDTWKGIYIKETFVGYVHTTLVPAAKGHTITSLSYLRFRMFDQLKDLAITSRQTLDDDYRLTAFETRISGFAGISLKGKRMGNQIITDITCNNRSYSKTFDVTDDLFLDQSLLQLYRGKDLKVGDSYMLSILNPLTIATERIETTAVGTEGDSLVMETKYAGLLSKTWVAPDGLVIREETPNGWVIRTEEKEVIEAHLARLDGGTIDILRETAVKTTRKIENPRSLSSLTLRVSGISLKDFDIDGVRQKLADGERGVVEITALGPGGAPPDITSLNTPELRAFLQPSPWIDSDHPAIMSAARDIVGGERNSWTAAVTIGRWVHRHLGKALVPDIPVASTVLQRASGDCNEHAALFIALARAAGIPSQMCAGLVYMHDGFYYHAWPKVFVGRWVHLDPTIDQSVADATHLELVSGDFAAQSRIALAMGAIGIEILTSSTDSCSEKAPPVSMGKEIGHVPVPSTTVAEGVHH